MERKILYLCSLILFLQISLKAQVQVENSKNLRYSREEVRLSYEIARRQVIEDVFPNRKEHLPELPIVLKLGCKDPETGEEYVDTSRLKGSKKAVICLQEWDLEKFTSGLILIMQTHLISDTKRYELLEDIIHRVQLTAPVSVADIQNKK